MISVILTTLDGKFVVRGIIPFFKTLPNVILWRTRVFQIYDPNPEKLEYRECFAVYLVNEDN